MSGVLLSTMMYCVYRTKHASIRRELKLLSTTDRTNEGRLRAMEGVERAERA